MFESFKTKSTIAFALADTLSFTKLADHVGESITIYGFFFNEKGKYGTQVNVVTSPENAITLPNRFVEKFRGLSDEEITAITEGKVTLSNIREHETTKGMSTTFDIELNGGN